jgi:hypothetical protein
MMMDESYGKICPKCAQLIMMLDINLQVIYVKNVVVNSLRSLAVLPSEFQIRITLVSAPRTLLDGP